MEISNNKDSPPRYLPNEYPHVCPFDHKAFLGRKNRVYCPDTKCKEAHAYLKRCIKIQMTKAEITAYMKTVSVFNEYCNNSDQPITLSTALVKSRGVDFKVTPYKMLKDEIDGSTWYGVGPYEYHFSSDYIKVTIRKSHKSKIN